MDSGLHRGAGELIGTELILEFEMTEPLVNDQRKAELLSKQVRHIDIKSFDARPIIDQMEGMSFTSRDLARATRIYNQMLEDKDCSIFLVIAGSTSAGGCMDLYAELVRNNMVDGIVATGATIVATIGRASWRARGCQYV